MQVRTVTAKEAQALLQQQPGGYVLVDVRNQDEQQVRVWHTSCTDIALACSTL
jgi:hypothetical protein